MPRFFVESIVGETTLIEGEDARHIAKSLRMQVGEELTLCDGRGWDYRCKLLSVGAGFVEAKVLEKIPNRSEPSVKITLYQALPKGDKLDLIIQKATELGVAEIVPVLTSRCISRPDGKGMEKKRQRLQKITLEAAKQSGRGMIPEIMPLLPYEKALEGMKQAESAILFYEKADQLFSEVLPHRPGRVALMIGCEGGFSTEEAALAQEMGIVQASLGRRILRCETAPICAISALLYAAGEI